MGDGDVDIGIGTNSVRMTARAICSAGVHTRHGSKEVGVRTVDAGIDLCALSMDVSASGRVTDGWIRTEGVGGQRGQLVETILEGGVLLVASADRTNTHNQITGVSNGGYTLIEESYPLSLRLQEGLLDPGGRIGEGGVELQTGEEPQVLDLDGVIGI